MAAFTLVYCVNGARGESADGPQNAVCGRLLRMTGWLCMTGWYPALARSLEISRDFSGTGVIPECRDTGPALWWLKE